MNRGAALLFVFFSLLFFILVGRFLYIQITGQVDGQVLAVKAQEKTLKEKAVEIPAKVGGCVNLELEEAQQLYLLLRKMQGSFATEE